MSIKSLDRAIMISTAATVLGFGLFCGAIVSLAKDFNAAGSAARTTLVQEGFTPVSEWGSSFYSIKTGDAYDFKYVTKQISTGAVGFVTMHCEKSGKSPTVCSIPK